MNAVRCPWALATAAALAACGKDGPSGPPSSRVARITIAPADTTVRVGADVPLRVTAFNASGQVLSDVPIRFTSSADEVATVSAAGVLGANAIGNVTITATTTAAPVTAIAKARVAPVVVELPFPQGAQHVEIYGVNDARTVVGAGYFANGDPPRAFAYSPVRGSVNLAVLNPNEPIPSQARGVNASGVITGYATRSGGFKRVVTWTPDGAIQDLGIAGFSQTYGIAINNAGQIAAYGDAVNTQQYKEHAYFYDPATRTYTDLLALAGKEGVSQPAAISETGVVVGGSPRPSDGFLVGFTWNRSDGMREVAPPQGIGAVMGIASDGSVSGWYNPVPAGFPTSRGFFRKPNVSPVDIGTLGGNQTQPAGMNARGDVVGWSLTTAGVRQAFVWSESGGMTDLGTEFGLPSRASAVSRGVVAGTVNVTADPPPFNQRGINERPVIWIIRRVP